MRLFLLVCVLWLAFIVAFWLYIFSARAKRCKRVPKQIALRFPSIDIEDLEDFPEVVLWGITEAQWKAALNSYREVREKQGMLSFPGLMVIGGNQDEAEHESQICGGNHKGRFERGKVHPRMSARDG